MQLRWIAIVISLLSITNLKAQEVFDLKACLDYAVTNNFDLLKTAMEKENTKYRIKEQMSSGLPQISGSASFSDNILMPTQLIPGEVFGGAPGSFIPVKFGVHYSVGAGIDVSQLLFSQQFFTGLKAARKAEDIVDLSIEQAKEQIVYNIAAYYYQAQAFKIQIKMIQDNYDRLSKITEIADVQYKNDMIKKLDLDQLVINKKNLETQLNNAKIAYNQQINALKIIMGMTPDADLKLVDEEIQVSSEQYDAANKNINNIAQRLLTSKLEISELEYKAVKAGYFPSLYMNFNTSINGQFDKFKFKEPNSFVRYPYMLLGLSLNVPIFDGLKRSSQLKQKQVAMEQLKLDQEKTSRQLGLQYQNAVYTIEQNRLNYANQKENLDFANQFYDAIKYTYNEGMSNLTELINAENSLKDAQNNYLNSLMKIKISELDELYISGNINELLK